MMASSTCVGVHVPCPAASPRLAATPYPAVAGGLGGYPLLMLLCRCNFFQARDKGGLGENFLNNVHDDSHFGLHHNALYRYCHKKSQVPQ